MGTVVLSLSLTLQGDDSGDLAVKQPYGASPTETQGLLEPLKWSSRWVVAGLVSLQGPALSLLFLLLFVLAYMVLFLILVCFICMFGCATRHSCMEVRGHAWESVLSYCGVGPGE